MKKFLCGILSLILVMTSIQVSTLTVDAAETNEMTIYSIFLGKGSVAATDGGSTDGKSGNGGDAVLIESNGKYLLMDMGYYDQTVQYVIPFLEKMGVKSLSVYFSHMHIDHYGGQDVDITAGLDKLASKMTIENLYLPASTIGKADKEYVQKYQKFVDAYHEYDHTKGKVVRLKKGSTFTIGSAKAEVLGPLKETASIKTFGDGFQNNMSLVTMITCGKTKYLTAGDIMEEQEKLLVEEYKGTSKLKADIMKLSHHGTPQANSEAFIKLVKPMYSFAQISGYTGMLSEKPKDGYKWKIMYKAWNTLNQYGLCYFTSTEGKNLVINVKNDVISLYRSKMTPANQLKGLVSLKGGTGFKDDSVVQYYIENNGKLAKGIKTISGKKYYFDYCKLRGKYSAKDKEWNPLYAVGNSYRYFDTQTGQMVVGFKKIDGKLYYHNKKDGLRVMGSGGEKSWKLKKLEGNYYALNGNGVIAQKEQKKISKKWYYFDKDGKMVTGWQTIGKDKYYFDKNGVRTDNKIKKIGKYKYYFISSGKMIAGKMWNIGKYRYYFDKQGRMAIKKFVTQKGKKYYFDKDGHMVKENFVTIGKDKYYFDGGGKMLQSAFRNVGKYRYYFDKDGKMVKNKTITIGGKKYKFDKNGHLVK